MKSSSLLTALLMAAAVAAGAPAVAAAPAAPAGVGAPAADQVPAVVDRIMNAVGLQPRFVVVASDLVPNAAAVMIEGQRCILYNPGFVRAVNEATQTSWAGVSILAHEIGHHLNGHTLSADPKNQESSYRDELEADEFSGFVLRRMGASAEQAIAALSLLAPEEDSPTHPPRSTRLAAVAAGWNSGSQEEAAPAAVARVAPRPVPAPSPAPVVKRAPASAEAAWRLNPAVVAGQLTFDATPGRVIYLTKRLHLVADSPKGARVLGSLEPTGSRRYPYRLVQTDGRGALYVTTRGTVVNPAGRRVGQLSI